MNASDTVTDFFITDFAGTGISVSANDDTVETCTIESNAGSGITASGVGGAYIVGNLVSGNTGIGIFLFGSGTDDCTVELNYVGIAFDGASALGNSSGGVDISDDASNNAILQNVISGNGLFGGVFISDVGTTENRVEDT